MTYKGESIWQTPTQEDKESFPFNFQCNAYTLTQILDYKETGAFEGPIKVFFNKSDFSFWSLPYIVRFEEEEDLVKFKLVQK